MRIALHDYSGHPFQVQLARELARRRHRVLHLHCASYRTGKGALRRRSDDPEAFDVQGISLDEPLAKYSPRKRPFQELEYARRLTRRVKEFCPDVVISSNNPLLSQWAFLTACRRRSIPFVFWQQDIYSVAMKKAVEKALPLFGGFIGSGFLALERRLLLASNAIVPISEDFVPTLDSWGIPRGKIHVIENWAPLDELPVRPRLNAWSHAHGLASKRVVLYSGTLGLKHDPSLLLELARRFRYDDGVRVVVVSEGPGAEWLASMSRAEALLNLSVLPFQPYLDLPDVLASADVLAVILDAEAGLFSVPSKVLSYHCAQRPLLAAIPERNLAARIVAKAHSGFVVPPDDGEALFAAADRLLNDSDLAAELGGSARSYAERTFDITLIGDRFEHVLEQAIWKRQPSATMARSERWTEMT